MKRFIVFSLLICGTLALCGFAGCAEGVTASCSTNRGTVFIDNRTHSCVTVQIQAPAGATSEPGQRICPSMEEGGEVHLPMVLISSEYNHNVVLRSEGRTTVTATPSTVRVACGRTQVVVLTDSTTGTDPLPQINVDQRDLHPAISGSLRGLEIPPCLSASTQSPESLNLLPYSAYGAQGILNQVRANKEHLENFFAEHFPEAYAEAGGEAVMVEETTVFPDTGSPVYMHSDGSRSEIIAAYTYTVAPQFRTFNDGRAEGGTVSIVRQHWTDRYGKVWDAYEARLTAGTNPLSYSNVSFQEVSTTDGSRWDWDHVHWIHAKAEYPAGRLEYQLVYLKEACFNGWLNTEYRYRPLLASFDLPFSSWRDTPDSTRANCYLKEILKSVRGSRDFFRRKLMDASGSDRLRLEPTEGGGFNLLYDGTRECSTDVLGAS